MNAKPQPQQPAVQVAVTHAERAAHLITWKPWPLPNPSLIGHATVTFSGWTVRGIPVFRRGGDGGLSVGVPSAAELDSEGRIKQRDGKRQYQAVISFENAEARERWQRSVLAALVAGGIVGEAAQ